MTTQKKNNKNLKKVGQFYPKLNNINGTDLPLKKIYVSEGLPKHLIKSNHSNVLNYLSDISDIINNPDYIGVNPRENGKSIELVKVYDQNIQIGIKLDCANNYYYVASMYEVKESKIQRRLHSGRLKRFR